MSTLSDAREKMMNCLAEVEATEKRLNNLPNSEEARGWVIKEHLKKLNAEFDSAWDEWNVASQQHRLKKVFES